MSKSSVSGFESELVVTAVATLLDDDMVTGDDMVTSDDTGTGEDTVTDDNSDRGWYGDK